MKNVIMRVEDDKLILEVDLTQEFGPSKSGKTVIVASTEGSVPVPSNPEIQVGVNVYKSSGSSRPPSPGAQ